jgi:hypothetical protein
MTEHHADADANAEPHHQLLARAHEMNKTIIFDALAALGVARIIARFRGKNGDPGIPQMLIVDAAGNILQLPKTWITFYFVCDIKAPKIREDEDLLTCALCELCFEYISVQYALGWEQDEGCHGQLTLDITKRTAHA